MMSKNKRILTLTITCAVLSLACFLAVETGCHFYLAKGSTVQEVAARYGEPLWTDGSEEHNDLHLYYYTGILNVVDLKSEKGIVVDVEISAED